MKIVVAGALGHIGSRLVRDLPFSFPGSEIVMVDNMMTQRYCSLFNLPKEGSYRFIEAPFLKLRTRYITVVSTEQRAEDVLPSRRAPIGVQGEGVGGCR